MAKHSILKKANVILLTHFSKVKHPMELTQSRKSNLLHVIYNKIFVCALLSFFAALGTVPYGYRYAGSIGWNSAAFLVVFGAIFAATAALANLMLGTYSLLNIKNDKKDKVNFNIILVSSLGAVPYGFLCYFGYRDSLPSVVSIAISVIVVIVNAGIGYTAISNLLITSKAMMNHKKNADSASKPEIIVRVLGFVVGLAISLVTYLAASSGITDLLIHYNQTLLLQYNTGFILAILSWIPCAALFANANQIVAGDLYKKVADIKAFVKGISLTNILFLLYCLASGTAIAQMTSDSFDPEKNIPEFFKVDFVQFIVQHYLISIALISSAALNYFSIQKLIHNLKVKSTAHQSEIP